MMRRINKKRSKWFWQFKSNFYLLLLFTFLQQNGFATTNTRTLPVELFGIKEGLSQGFVLRIIQDRDGYMWFSTKDGLNRWDGYHMTIFRNIIDDSTSIQDNSITSIIEDDKGRFWVGTSTKGIFLLDKKTNTFHRFGDKTIRNWGISELQYRNDSLMITTFDNLYLINVQQIRPNDFSKENLEKFRIVMDFNRSTSGFSKPLNSLRYSVAMLLKDGRIIVTLLDKFLVFTADKSPEKCAIKIIPTESLGIPPSIYYWTSTIPNQDSLIIIYQDRVKIISSVTFKTGSTWVIDVDKNLESRSHILTDNLIIISNQKKDYMLDSKLHELAELKMTMNRKVNILNDAYVDRNGVAWAGTTDAIGIIRYDPAKSSFQNFPFLANCIIPYTNNNVLIPHNSSCYTLNVTTGERTEIPNVNQLTVASGLSTTSMDGNEIYSINYELKTQGQLLNKYNITTHRRILREIKETEICTRIFFDHRNRFWCVAGKQDESRWLVEIDRETLNEIRRFKFPNIKNNNPFAFVSAWLPADNGKLWLGTLDGLFLFDPDEQNINQQWKHWQKKENQPQTLSENQIYSLCADPKSPDKYLWIGTNGGGLNRFEIKTGKCKRFTVEDGLPNNVIYGILADKKNHLWMSTNQGLSRIDLSNFSVRTYTENDGLPNNEFNRYLSCKLTENKLIFGGVNGITVFNPDELNSTKPASNILFTGLSIFNKPVNFKMNPEIISIPVQYAKTITLPAGSNMFSLEFAVMDMLSTDQKSYKYTLEGFDNDWIQSGKSNIATYTNISPGEYLFKVTGTNSDGVWCKEPAVIQIIILPQWWETWWFRLLLIITVLGMAYGFYRYRLYQILKMQSIRNNIASDLHDEIGSTLSSISLYGVSASKLIPPENPAQHILKKISSNTTAMLESMSDIVWAINTRNDQFDNLTNRMNAFAYEVMEPRNIEVHFQINNAAKLQYFQMEDRKNIYLLFKEIVNNAARHSQCKNIWIDTGLENGKFYLKIKDDGIGFKLNSEKIQTVKGMGGNGLNNIQKRAKSLNANLIVKSEPNKGTEFYLTMKK